MNYQPDIHTPIQPQPLEYFREIMRREVKVNMMDSKYGPYRKLTDEQVIAIRRMARDGIRQMMIAMVVGTTQTTVGDILRNEIYRDVQ